MSIIKTNISEVNKYINMGTIYSASGKMARNIEEVLHAELTEVNISGKTVLLKPNMVDPSIKNACSNAQNLQIAANALINHGAAEVLIGDEPALYFFEKVVGNRIYNPNVPNDPLRYHAITTAVPRTSLIDLRTLPLTSFQATRLNPITAKEEKIEIPIRDTNGLMVFSFGFPKHHGNYNYTGVLKNLMGLVPAKERPKYFHHSFMDYVTSLSRPEDDAFDLALSFADKTRQMPTVDRAYEMWLDKTINPVALMCHLEHIVNAGVLAGLREYFNKQKGICLLDGTHLMAKHEHDGELVQTDFAIAGTDPANVDYAALAKLGINPLDVPYLQACRKANSYSMGGKLGKPLNPTCLLQKETFEDSHGIKGFLRCPGN